MPYEQSESPTASGYRGFFYHFLDMETGQRAWECELSTIDTALLMAGVLTAAAYFHADTPDETEVRSLANRAVRTRRVGLDGRRAGHDLPRLEARDGQAAVALGRLRRGADPVPAGARLAHARHPQSSSYDAWCSTYQWQEVEGLSYLHAGPLFIHQMSHLWVDFRGLRDAFMRAHDSDYFINSRIGAHVQQRYAIRNPRRHALYGEFVWGITASDGPGAVRWRQPFESPFFDYVARGVPEGPDDGTLAPWAVVASLPFAPEIVLPTIANYRHIQLHVANPYGFKASFNPSFPSDRKHAFGWVSPYHFGINEGPTVVMIENHRSGMIWNLMRNCAPLVSRPAPRRLRRRLAGRHPARRRARTAGRAARAAGRLARRSRMNITLAGRRALVTGANSGIGQAIALAFGDAGADVVVNYVTHPAFAHGG